MAKRVLVIGGAGFIGSHLVDRLVTDGYKVRILDNLEPQVHVDVPDYLNPEAEFVRGDVRAEDDLARGLKDIDVVFHYAAMVGVGQSMYQIHKYTEVNTIGTAKLLETIVNSYRDLEKLIVASSMSVYGEGAYKCESCGMVYPKTRSESQLEAAEWELACPRCGKPAKPVPTDEDKPLYPTSVYAITKMDQEELCLSVGRAYGVPTVALRFFNTYGTRQSLSNPYTGVCAIFLSRIRSGKPPLIFEDGLQTRDFVSVHDVVQASMLAMNSTEADYECFNVGTGKPVTILEVAKTLSLLCGYKQEPELVGKYRAGDIRHCYADISKIKSKLNFEPRVDLATGMRELIEWSETAQFEDRTRQAQEELIKRKLIK